MNCYNCNCLKISQVCNNCEDYTICETCLGCSVEEMDAHFLCPCCKKGDDGKGARWQRGPGAVPRSSRRLRGRNHGVKREEGDEQGGEEGEEDDDDEEEDSDDVVILGEKTSSGSFVVTPLLDRKHQQKSRGEELGDEDDNPEEEPRKRCERKRRCSRNADEEGGVAPRRVLFSGEEFDQVSTKILSKLQKIGMRHSCTKNICRF